jgi:hypothetical protein
VAEFVEIDAGETLWRFNRQFLESNWTCIWGRGCKGIAAEANTTNGHGCCSLGAVLDGPEEALNIAALADTLPSGLFQHHAEAKDGGVFSDDAAIATRVIDGACIFLNHVGFSGGEGCALHLGAQHYNEPPVEWKPSVCWQLPIKVDWEMRDDNVEVATVRGWERRDWGTHGTTMAWCCTEGDDAYVGDTSVAESLATEITEVVGEVVYVQLRERLQKGD